MPPSPPGTGLGKGMLAVCWLGALALLTWYWHGQQDRAVHPNRAATASTADDGAIELALRRNRQGHYTLQGRIQGHPVDFLLDTGATDVVLPGDLAGKLNLPQLGEARVRTAAGVITVYRTHLQTLDLAGIPLRDVDAVINPHMQDTGLLGMSALRQVEFIHRNGRMLLRWHPR